MSSVCERTINGRPICALRDPRMRVAIARVEAAHEADHHLEVRLQRGFRLDALAFADVERQRLFAEHVLARAQRVDDLLRVQRRRRDEEHRVDVRLREHLRIVGVATARRRDARSAHASSSATRVCTPRRAPRCGTRVREIFRVPRGPCRPRPAMPTRNRASSWRPSALIARRCASRATTSSRRRPARAPSTPSSIVVRTGVPPAERRRRNAPSRPRTRRDSARGRNARACRRLTAPDDHSVTSVGRWLPACSMPLLPITSKRWS